MFVSDRLNDKKDERDDNDNDRVVFQKTNQTILLDCVHPDTAIVKIYMNRNTRAQYINQK